MIIRIIYKYTPSHVHCRVFTSKAANMTFAKVGDLVFTVEEWGKVCDTWNSSNVCSVEFLEGHYEL